MSLHDVSFYPGNDPCDKNDTEGINIFLHYLLNQQKDKIAPHLSPSEMLLSSSINYRNHAFEIIKNDGFGGEGVRS